MIGAGGRTASANRKSALQQFDSAATGERHAREYLRRIPGVDDFAALAVVRGWGLVVEESVPQAAYPPGAVPAFVPGLRWVIRDADLRLAETLLESLTIAAASGFFMHPDIKDPARWAATAGIAAKLFQLLKAARTKGRRLDRRRFEMLMTIRERGPLTLPDLYSLLKERDKTWTKKLVARELGVLKTLALVVADVDARWRADGI